MWGRIRSAAQWVGRAFRWLGEKLGIISVSASPANDVSDNTIPFENEISAVPPLVSPLSLREEKKESPVIGEEAFLRLGQDINHTISENLDAKSLAILACTSQSMWYSSDSLFKKPLEQRALQLLLEYIVRGKPDEALKILAFKPELLLKRGTVRDYAGYTFKNRTPLQAALCCQDPQMAEEIQKLLIKYAGPEEAARQWDAQFPAGWEEAEAERWEPVFTQLKKLDDTIQAAEEKDISADQNYKLQIREGSAVKRELEEFQRLLRATRDEPITTGRAFNPLLLLELSNRYDRYLGFSFFNHCKCLFFWQRILGYAQRFVSTPDAQAFVVGLHHTKYTLENKKPQSRNLEIPTWVEDQVVAISYYSGAWLDSDYAVFLGLVQGGVAVSCGLSACPRLLEDFYQSKTGAFQKLMPRDIQLQPQCIIRPAVL